MSCRVGRFVGLLTDGDILFYRTRNHSNYMFYLARQ